MQASSALSSALFKPFMIAVIIFFIALWYFSLFFQTFFQHRYGAHAAFTMSKPWERVFFVFTWILQGSSYLSPRAYAIMHRMHHAFADTEDDPHSPKYSKNLFDMMWKTKNVYTAIFDGRFPVDAKFTKNVPDWPAFDRFAHGWLPRIAFAALYTAFFVWVDAPIWTYFVLLPIILVMGPVHGAVINWFAHKYGYRNFETSNTSENLLHVDFLMLGESYHNNHHTYPSSPNFGVRWHEIDPVYYVILLFGKLGIIHIPKVATVKKKPQVEEVNV